MAAQAEGRQEMAALVAMLLEPPSANSSAQATPPATTMQSAASKATIPRSVPVEPALAPNETQRFNSSFQAYDSTPTISNASTLFDINQQTAALPTAPTESATSSSSDGPSLRGSTAQLNDARAFLLGATSGGSKSRGGSRGRVLSKEPARGPVSPAASIRSARATAPTYAPAVASPRPRPSTTQTASSGANTTGISGGFGQWQALRGPAAAKDDVSKSARVAATSPEKTAGVPALQSNPVSSATPNQKENVASPEAQMPIAALSTTASTGPGSAAPVPKMSTESAGAAQTGAKLSKTAPHQMADITKTLKERAVDVPATKLHDKSMVKTETAASPSSTLPPKERATTNGIGLKPVVADSKQSTHLSTSPEMRKKSTEAAATADEAVLAEVKKELAALRKRVDSLETENFVLQGQLERMIQAEERRKFLGTDKKAMAPFGVDVKDSNGNIVRVQATKSLKVGELIRRIRVKANLSPVASKDPRVTFDGEQLGHGMMLGEAGIEEESTVLFTHAK